MLRLIRLLSALMFLAGYSLVVNDVARLLFPCIQQALVAQICDEKGQDDNNPINAFSFFEEEVKHSVRDRFYTLQLTEIELEVAVAHLIQDDEIRHLAYIPIFSPPPNLA